MSTQTRVAVVGSEVTAGALLLERLDACGCSVISIASDQPLLDTLRARGPDVIVFHASDDTAPVFDNARALKGDAATRNTPIILVGAAAASNLRSEALDVGIDSVLPGDYSETELFIRIHTLARLKIMHSELERRDSTERRYGLGREPLSPNQVGVDRIAVLAAGDFDGDADMLSGIVGDSSSLVFAGDPRSALEKLYAGGFDAAVVALDDAPEAWLTLCRDVRDNTRLFNLPILLIIDKGRFDDLSKAYEYGATDVLVRPIDADELGSRLKFLIREQRFRRMVQEAHRRSLRGETADSLTGLYNFGFLHDYLANLIADAERWNKQVTVAAFDIEGLAACNQKYGYAGGDALLRQVGGMIGRLVRGEDLPARYGGGEFCVVMPNTSGDAALYPLGRIIHVAGLTEFGIPSCDEPVSIRLKMGRATFEPGDSAETLIARARAALV